METTENIGIIDIGSNTIKIHLYRCGANKEFKHYDYKSIRAGLLLDICDGKLTDGGIDKIIKTFQELVSFANERDCRKIYSFGTETMRKISNFGEIKATIASLFGIDIRLISGDEEALYNFKGALPNIDRKNGYIFEMGGGSTEGIFFKDKKIRYEFSMKFGSLYLYDRFVKNMFPTEDEIENLCDFVRTEFKRYDKAGKVKNVFFLGGTASSLRDLYVDRVEKKKIFTPDELYSFMMSFAFSDGKEEVIERICPIRRDTIIPGSLALITIARTLGAERIKFMKSGVREGFLMKILEEEQ